MKIYGFILTDAFAYSAFLLFKIKTGIRVNISDKGNSLRIVYVYGFIGRYVLIIWIRNHDRTVFYAGRTTRAFVFYDVSWLLYQVYLEVPCFAFYTVNLSKGQDLYVGMPADLDQFGCEYSHRAIIGGKGLVKLGHMAADGR